MTYEEFTKLTYSQAKNYPEKIAETSRVRYVMAEIAKDGKVLDAGCARGIDASKYNPSRYVGVDISPMLISVARKDNPRHTFVVMDARHLRFDDKSFDYVICKSVFEHLPSEEDAEMVFRELLRVGRNVLIGWHMPPNIDSSNIVRMKGHFGNTINSNRYRRNLFDTSSKHLEIIPVDNFELWVLGDKNG